MSTAPFDPSTFFVPGTDPDRLEYTAGDLKGDGADIAEGAADIHTAWGGLASCYSAPEAEMLFSAVDSVPDDAGEVDGALGTAATALTTFAEKARELRREAWALQGDARRFNARVADDEDWAKGTLFGGESEEYQEYTRINSEKIRIQNDFMAAEAECANAIIGLFSARRYTAVNPDGSTRLSGGEIAYGFTEITEELENAWGGPGIGVDHYWFWDVQHAVWDFGGGILENAGGMVGMHGAGGWDFEWSTNLDAHWWGVVEGAGAMVGLYDAEIDHWGFQSWERSREIAWDSAVEAAHAVVPWREWEERPAYVITTALLNVGTIVAGAALTSTGVGAAVGVPLLAYKGLKILDGVGGVPRGLTDALQNLVDSAASGRQGSGSGGPTPVISLTDDTLRALGIDPQRLRTLLTGLEALRDPHTGSPSGDGAADAERPADPTAAELAAGQEFLDGIDPGSRRELEEGLLGAEDAWVTSQVPDDVSSVNDTPVQRYETDPALIEDGQRVEVDSAGNEITAHHDGTITNSANNSGQASEGTHGSHHHTQSPLNGNYENESFGNSGSQFGDSEDLSAGAAFSNWESDGEGPDSHGSNAPPGDFGGLAADPSKEIPGGGLEANEEGVGVFGGHTIDRHVEKSIQYLKDRTMGLIEGAPSGRVAGSYHDLETAEFATATALRMKSEVIAEWLQQDMTIPSNRKLVLKEVDVGLGDIGYAVKRLGSAANPTGWESVDPSHVTVILFYEPGMQPHGFFVRTSFPVPPPD